MFIDSKILSQFKSKLSCEAYFPVDYLVVLGRTNKTYQEVDVQQCHSQNIPIVRRLGGGGTVLLSPSSFVVSIGTWVKDRFKNDLYFKLLNEAIVLTLNQVPHLSDKKFYQSGISDICYDNKKVAGTSLFRSRNYLIYQASILVELEIEKINSFLKHPSKEPEYREGRSHKDFLTSLVKIDSRINKSMIRASFSQSLRPNLFLQLQDEMISPEPPQFSHLDTKLNGL